MNKSLIIVVSPFQLLCAINAIHEYHILDYRLIFIDSERLDQMEGIAKHYKLKWEVQAPIVFEKRFGTLRLASHALRPQNDDYDSLIVGDVRDYNLMLQGLSYGRSFKKLIIVDDGNIMLSYFSGTMNISQKGKLYWQILKYITNLRKITIEFFSIYNADSKKFNIKNNSLQLHSNNDVKKEVVLFVGTNSSLHCDYYGYSKDKYLTVLKTLLYEFSNISPYEFQYIAHGRETFSEIRDICEELSIMYERLDDCIELYTLRNGLDLKNVYGFGSSALYNLKLMYPNANVYNIKLFGKDKTKIAEMESICNVYNSIGIVDYDIEGISRFQNV